MLAPRNESLRHLELHRQKVCDDLFCALDSALQTESKHRGFYQKRGKKRSMFGPSRKFPSATLGPKANMFSTGVSDDSYHVNHMKEKDIAAIKSFVCKMETVRDWCLPNHVIHDAWAAVELLDVKLLGNASTTTGFSLTAYNVQFRVHDDDNLTHSTVIVLKKGHVCTLDDCVVAYFCFPRLGLAVPMCPGDAITFNSQEPHCLSSRCHEPDIIYGMAIFMKSKVAGGNDNSIPNNAIEKYLAGKHESGVYHKSAK